jgi:hypothetical protein
MRKTLFLLLPAVALLGCTRDAAPSEPISASAAIAPVAQSSSTGGLTVGMKLVGFFPASVLSSSQTYAVLPGSSCNFYGWVAQKAPGPVQYIWSGFGRVESGTGWPIYFNEVPIGSYGPGRIYLWIQDSSGKTGESIVQFTTTPLGFNCNGPQ